MKTPKWVCGLADLRVLQVYRSVLAYTYRLPKSKLFKYWAISALSALILSVGSIAASAIEPQYSCPEQIQLAETPKFAAHSVAQPAFQSVPMAHTSSLGKFVRALPSLLAAQFAPPFPQINGLARIARVPILTYHNVLSSQSLFDQNLLEPVTDRDISAADFEAALKQIRAKGITPISLDQLTKHLSTGIPLPPKPILLTFDGGYIGHYQSVYPLLKEFGYPGVFAVYPGEIQNSAKSHLSWKQLKTMATDPLITIASHGLTPSLKPSLAPSLTPNLTPISTPTDLQPLPDDRLQAEVVESKRQLETKLGIPVRYFVYPTSTDPTSTDPTVKMGESDRIQTWVEQASYQAALAEPDPEAGDRFAGESASLLRLERMDQSQLAAAIEQANGGLPLPALGQTDNFKTPVQIDRRTVDHIPLILVSGGRPITIHADSRYQVPEIIAKTKIAQATAVAAVDGGYFSLETLQSNAMVGPVLSQNTQKFVPANAQEIKRLIGRPLVLINPDRVQFVPFDPARHNTLAGIRQEMPDVTDVFVAAAWLVKNGQPQPLQAFGNLYKVYEPRDRAFWGMNYAGQPVIGVTSDLVDSITLGNALSKAGLRDVVMLDSGASTSLAYRGESMMSFEPRPVPHVVALMSLQTQPQAARCSVVSRKE